MKISTIANRLEKNYKGSKNTLVYSTIKHICDNEYPKSCRSLYDIHTKLIRPTFTTGSGRFIKLNNYMNDMTNLLNILKIKYEVGNDAPKGGKCGNYIKLISKII